MGFNPTDKGGFLAHRRYIEALEKAQGATQAVEFTADDLLGNIFDSFFISK
jgi:hypothetical protein